MVIAAQFRLAVGNGNVVHFRDIAVFIAANRLVILIQVRVIIAHERPDGFGADMFLPLLILIYQHHRAFSKRKRPAQILRAVLLHAGITIRLRRFIDDIKAVGIASERFPRCARRFGVLLLHNQLADSRDHVAPAVRLNGVTHKRIQRHLEEVRQRCEYQNIRHALPVLPLRHSGGRYIHGFRQLFLRHAPLPPKRTNRIIQRHRRIALQKSYFV